MTTQATFRLKDIKRHLAHLRHLASTSGLPTSDCFPGTPGLSAPTVQMTPRQLRSFQVHLARTLHIANIAAQAYLDQIRRTSGPPKQMLSRHPLKALTSKYLPILLSTYAFVSENDIPINHWYRAQFDLLRPPPGCVNIPLTVTHGPNAHLRYVDWSRRQTKRFTQASDRTTALDTTFTGQIATHINLSHQFAIAALSKVAEMEHFSVEFFLWELFPDISPWYLVANDDFRKSFLETGACLTPKVVEHFQQYKRDPVVRQACDRAILAATDTFGDLLCIQTHSEQV